MLHIFTNLNSITLFTFCFKCYIYIYIYIYILYNLIEIKNNSSYYTNVASLDCDSNAVIASNFKWLQTFWASLD